MKQIITTALVLSGVVAYAQTGNVGINQETPKATLQIDVAAANSDNDTNQGLLIPKLTKARVAKIGNDNLKKGTLIYVDDANVSATNVNTKVSKITSNGFYHYDGENWVKGVGSDSSSTSLPNGTANGQVLKWNGTAWVADTDANTTYIAGMGININNTTISTATPTRYVDGNTTLTLSDHNGYVYVTAGTVTIPTGLPKGFSCIVVQKGADLKQVTLAGQSGVTLQSARGLYTRKQHSAVGVFMEETNLAIITGDAVSQ